MLRSLKNMDRAFHMNRILTIACVVGMCVVCLYSLNFVHSAQQEQSKIVYALMGDDAVSLRAVDIIENRPVEAHNHIELFHTRFFNLDPDREVIDRNIGLAMSMADNSVREIVQAFEEDDYYRNVIASNISQSVTTDSIQLDMTSFPYYFRYTGTMKIVRPSSIATRSLISEGYFRDVQRSQVNPHGFIIERYRVLANEDLNVVRRYD